MEEFPNNFLWDKIQTVDSGFQFGFYFMDEEQHIVRKPEHWVVYSDKEHSGEDEKVIIC